jgi:hypothetical protein
MDDPPLRFWGESSSTFPLQFIQRRIALAMLVRSGFRIGGEVHDLVPVLSAVFLPELAKLLP